jgi:dTDP-4-dehydrorhamnose 3,5-epimerase
MIDGVKIYDLNKYEDERGWLIETYRADERGFQAAMSYVSETKPGVARGPHEHVHQADYFVFIGPGRFRVYLWDNRDDSATKGEHMKIEAGAGEPKAMYVPKGVVHGYKCISDVPGWCINLPDKLYKGENKTEEVDELRWEDKPDSPFKID